MKSVSHANSLHSSASKEDLQGIIALEKTLFRKEKKKKRLYSLAFLYLFLEKKIIKLLEKLLISVLILSSLTLNINMLITMSSYRGDNHDTEPVSISVI